VKEPEKKSTKRKEIDTGKLMALRKAGWSMKNIGIELGCSEGTIFNYLKKMEENGNI
jgi:lambda repressor-like predicted transcriptional regulator